jgi:hypothetical protein
MNTYFWQEVISHEKLFLLRAPYYLNKIVAPKSWKGSVHGNGETWANHVSACYACSSASSAAERHAWGEDRLENDEQYQWSIKIKWSYFCLTLTTSLVCKFIGCSTWTNTDWVQPREPRLYGLARPWVQICYAWNLTGEPCFILLQNWRRGMPRGFSPSRCLYTRFCMRESSILL